MTQTILMLTEALKEALNSHDVDSILSFYAPDFEGMDVSQAKAQKGPEEIRQALNQYLEAFPDLRLENEDILLQGDRVALFWRAYGTHRGTWMNIPPTHRMVTVRGVSLLTIQSGKITQALSIWDLAGFLRAVRLLPEL
jgi:steroid delta-isomerase-like uncharacterized protein